MAGQKIIRFLSVYLLAFAPAYQLISQENKVQIEPRPKKPDVQSREKNPRANIRSDTSLVQVQLTVVDPFYRLVTGLRKEIFRIYEDKVEQEVLYLSNEDAPIAIGIVFDISGSMGSKLKMSREAIGQFLKLANNEDKFFLVQFNDRPETVVNFTRDTGEIINKLTFAESKGHTALLDAIYLSINNMKKAGAIRKAILIISDGGDNNSRYTESEVKNMVREADVQIYAIGIFEPISNRTRSSEELAGPELLTKITESTGGRHFPVENLNDLPDVAMKIGIELRNQYVLYYSPKNKTRDGKYRRIQVKLAQPKMLPPLKAYFRTGYYAPIE